MRPALLAWGVLSLVLALVPYWGTEDYFGIKRVHEFGVGFDLYKVRIVESGHAGQADWKELGRITDFEPLGVSSMLLLMGAAALVGSRHVRRGSQMHPQLT